MMGTILLIIVVCLSDIVCLVIGARIGQKAIRGEEINLPNPINQVQAYQADRENKKRREAIETMMRNIDTYDGTGFGQQDIAQ